MKARVRHKRKRWTNEEVVVDREPLTEFARRDDLKPGYDAWIRSIPEFEEVKAAVGANVKLSKIRRWLIEVCGYSPDEATTSKVQGYLATHRHEL